MITPDYQKVISNPKMAYSCDLVDIDYHGLSWSIMDYHGLDFYILISYRLTDEQTYLH